MYHQLSNNMQAAIDTDNKEAALGAVLEAGDAFNADAITLEEYSSIRGDFTEAYPDLI